MMQRCLMLSLLVTLVSLTAFSQQTKKKKDRFPSYFGLTAAPIFGSNFIGFQEHFFSGYSTFKHNIVYTKNGIYIRSVCANRCYKAY